MKKAVSDNDPSSAPSKSNKLKKHKSVKRESHGRRNVSPNMVGEVELGNKQVDLNPVQMAQYIKGHVSRENSTEKIKERDIDKIKKDMGHIARNLAKDEAYKDKKQHAPRFLSNLSSEEDDYNFLSDEGEMEKETITTHLVKNQGHRGFIST